MFRLTINRSDELYSLKALKKVIIRVTSYLSESVPVVFYLFNYMHYFKIDFYLCLNGWLVVINRRYDFIDLLKEKIYVLVYV